MIIGGGDIARVIIYRENRLYFAAGVSNSLEVRESEYLRERLLLQQQDRFRHIVYFGSLSIFYSDTRYAQHKRQMEELVKKIFRHYTIIRLGNITWGTNPHTLINALRDKIRRRERFPVMDVYRYLIDKEEFLYWLDLIPDWNCEMNLPGRRMKVKDIITEYCNVV
jgi:hypothetical protein